MGSSKHDQVLVCVFFMRSGFIWGVYVLHNYFTFKSILFSILFSTLVTFPVWRLCLVEPWWGFELWSHLTKSLAYWPSDQHLLTGEGATHRNSVLLCLGGVPTVQGQGPAFTTGLPASLWTKLRQWCPDSISLPTGSPLHYSQSTMHGKTGTRNKAPLVCCSMKQWCSEAMGWLSLCTSYTREVHRIMIAWVTSVQLKCIVLYCLASWFSSFCVLEHNATQRQELCQWESLTVWSCRSLLRAKKEPGSSWTLSNVFIFCSQVFKGSD